MADKQLVVTLIGNASSLRQAFGQAGEAASVFTTRAEQVGRQLSGIGDRMTVGVTLPLVAGFTAATAAAAADAQQQSVLQHALEQNVGATDEVVRATEDWITSMQMATGVADGELRAAMTELVNKGSDVAESQRIVEAALNLAAGAGVSFETAVTALAKAADGNTTALGRMGIQAGSLDEALQIVSETMGGSAAAAADTAAGRMQIAQERMAEAAETIGAALLPVLERLATWLSTIAEWFQNLSPGMQTAIIAFGALVAAIGPLLSITGRLISVSSSLVGAFKGMSTGAGAAGAALGLLGIVIGGLIMQHQQYKAAIDEIRTAIRGLDAESAQFAATQRLIEAGVTGAGLAAAISATAYGTATEAQRELADSSFITVGLVDQLRAAIVDETMAVAAMRLATIEAGKSFVDLAANAETAHQGVQTVTDAVGRMPAVYAPGEAATRGLASAQADVHAKFDAATASMNAQQDTLRAMTDPVFAAIQASGELAAAQATLTQMQQGGTASAAELAAAELDVVSAHIAVRDANDQLAASPGAAQAFNSAASAALSARGGVEQLRGSLDQIEAQLERLDGRNYKFTVDGSVTAAGKAAAATGSFLDGRS